MNINNTQFFWPIGIFAIGLALGLVLGGFLGAVTGQSSPMMTTQIGSDTQEEINKQAVKATSDLWETMEFEGEQYKVLQKETVMNEIGEELTVMHLCSGAVSQSYIGDDLSTAWCGIPEWTRLVVVSSHGATNLYLGESDHTGVASRNLLRSVRMFPNSSKLIVVFEPSGCDYVGMCIDTFSGPAFLFDLKSGERVGEIPLVWGVINLDQLMFNLSATKYMIEVPCVEGCPDEIVKGYDLEKKKLISVTDQISRSDSDSDYYWWPDVEKSHWIDDATFQLTVWHRLPQSDEREIKTIDLEL
ncbi:hypothetical protein HY771_03445 [Candidatus Uhrbacteria bacterium]|nr:hypothetical protein [Candidatus Uhrbacteria bacterium]